MMAAALALLAMTACASDRYAGIDLRPGGAPAAVQSLARAARSGDKHAQLALGDRYERGEGVTQDRDRADALYRAAATDSGGMRMMFVPRAGGGVSAVPVSLGAAVAGLAEARTKLASVLSAKGERRTPLGAADDTRQSSTPIDRSDTIGKIDTDGGKWVNLANDIGVRIKHLRAICDFQSPNMSRFSGKRLSAIIGRADGLNAVVTDWRRSLSINYSAKSLLLDFETGNRLYSKGNFGEGAIVRILASGELANLPTNCYYQGYYQGIIIIRHYRVVEVVPFSKLQKD